MTNKDLYTQIANAIRFDECITILGFKDDGICEVVQMINGDSDVNSWLQKKSGKQFNSKLFGIKLLQALAQSDPEKDVLEFLGLGENIKKTFSKLMDQPEKIVLIVGEIDKLADPAEAIQQFDELLKYYKRKITCVYILEDVSIFLNVQSQLESNSSFFENTYIQPLEGVKERESLEKMCGEKYGTIKSSKTMKKIFENSYGHYELYKRLYKAEVTKNYESLDNYVKRLVASFGDEALRIFRKLINDVQLEEYEQRIVEVYEELGFIQKGKIRIPMLRKYIKDLTPKTEIRLDRETGKIVFQNLQHFSKSEITMLKMFLENEGEIITKEDIGRVLWGRKFDEKYSPWAIDQSIFRLRLKMDRLHIAGRVKTIHGKGYIFSG